MPSYQQAALSGVQDARPPIETFDNQFPEVLYLHEITVAEFTSMCPKTGMPDFGVVQIRYVADVKCLELKSLKYYFYDYRGRGIFYENLVNVILTDLVAACAPKFMEVVLEMTPRGGVRSRLVRRFASSDAVAAAGEDLLSALV